MCKITIITSLYNCTKYLEGYFKAVEKISNQSEIELLLLHNAPQLSELYIIEKYTSKFSFIRHVIIPEVEGLYSTWNRGIKMAKGKYIAIWNTDDIRLPFSILDQARSLDLNPDAAISYGDFIIVNKYGTQDGRRIIEPEFNCNAKSFLRKHHIGCFPMWRKDIHNDIGYFDEQFRLVADLDFQIRVSLKYSLIKVEGNLGYYLENTPSNLSSNRKLQRTERTALNIRYGNFDLLHLPYLLSSIKQIQISKYRWFGNYYSKNVWTDGNRISIYSKLPLLFVSILNLPIDTLRFVKYSLPKSNLGRD